MPILSFFYGIIIRMNWRDHNPPHIHVEYQDNKVIIGLDGEIIEGKMPKKQLRLVQAWMELHRDEVEANWKLAQNKDELYKIAPLK